MARLHEAQANMAYYGFKRVPEEDFSDDGTRFFMWVWDPEDTGHSPFFFSKAGGYGEVFFSEHIYYMYGKANDLRKAIRDHGYHLDDLNGVSKEHFTDEALGKIVAQLQEIRESSWFEDICPEFSTRGAIDSGVQVKDYNADKDHQRVMDIAKRADSDPVKMAKLAANMAKAIKDKEKMRSRWQAAVDVYGAESPVAKAFEAQVKDNGWYINIKPRSGDIDWSSLFESVMTIKESTNQDLAEEIAGIIDNTKAFMSKINGNYIYIISRDGDGEMASFELDKGVAHDYAPRTLIPSSAGNGKNTFKICDPSLSDWSDGGRTFFLIYEKEEIYLPKLKNRFKDLVRYLTLKTLYENDDKELNGWHCAQWGTWKFKISSIDDVKKYLATLEDAYYEADDMLPPMYVEESTTNLNNSSNKLNEVAYEDYIEIALKKYFGTKDIIKSDETCWGLPAYEVDDATYAVGSSDECYDAAVRAAISIFDEDTDENKVDWLQKHNWVGVDEDGVCDACGDDPDDYEEGETVYIPDTINEYIDTMGYSEAHDAFGWEFLKNYVDKQEIGEYIVDSDGVANSLATYDGKEIKLPDGLYAFRFR